MKPLTNEIRTYIIQKRLIARRIMDLHRRGWGVGRIQKEIDTWSTVPELGLEQHLKEEMDKYCKWKKNQKKVA